jgi:hypothetical protein
MADKKNAVFFLPIIALALERFAEGCAIGYLNKCGIIHSFYQFDFQPAAR